MRQAGSFWLDGNPVHPQVFFYNYPLLQVDIVSFLGVVEVGLLWSFRSRLFRLTAWFAGWAFFVFPCLGIGKLEGEWVAEGLEESGVEICVLRNSGKVGDGLLRCLFALG